ncbi:RNA polymerase sigma factor [Streptomyces sp. NPDC003027]
MAPSQVTDAMIAAAQGGDSDALWQIVSAYEGVIRHAVRSVAPAAGQEDAEDLLQEARMVLIQYIRAYDTETSGAKLQTFTHHGIRRAVAEEWIRMSTAATVDPTTVIRVRQALATCGGDIAEAWMIISTGEGKGHISYDRFISTVEALQGVASLDMPQNHSKTTNFGGSVTDSTLADTIPDTSADFTDPTERRELARYVLREIPQRQAFALRSFYGIGVMRQEDAETAHVMGVKPGALRRLRNAGIESARRLLSRYDVAA